VSYSSVVLADGPIGFWPMLDYADATAGGHDLSVGGGAPANGQASFLPGDTGGSAGATEVDGSSWLAGIVFRYPQADSQSCEVWIKTTASDGAILGCDANYVFMVVGGKFGIVRTDGGDPVTASGGPDIDDDAPHHLVAAWNGDHSVTLYVDGEAVATGSCYLSNYWLSPSTGRLGGYGSGTWFSGLLQDVATYGFELSAGQVAAHYDAGMPSGSTLDASSTGASASGGAAAGALATVLVGAAAGASGSGGSASASMPVPLEATASGGSVSGGGAAGDLARAWEGQVAGHSASTGRAAGLLAHALPAVARGESASGGRAGATVVVFSPLARPLPLGQGSYNGISWGPGQQVQIIEHEGIEETPPTRNTDEDRGGLDGQWASDRDPYGPRTVTVTFALLGSSNADLRRLLAEVERAWQPDGRDRPMLLFDGARVLNARVRKRSFQHWLGGRERTARVTVQWYAKDPFYYESVEQVVTLVPNVAQLVSNPGDVEAPVRIRLAGPATGATFSRDDIGAQLWLAVVLHTGEVLDLNSDVRSALVNGVPNADWLDPRGRWWHLKVGVNQVRYWSQSNGPGEQAVLTFSVPRV
jgi:Concanavalin A-like lectin/glucanases superfamily